MKTVEYKGKTYKCEITSRDTNATRIRVYDENNVGNLYIWTKGYPMPRPYQYNRSKLIVKNVVLLAFKELTAPKEAEVIVDTQDIVAKEPVVNAPVTEEPKRTMPGRRRRNAVADRF